MARLLIVDGHAYAYRAFYAIRSLRSPTGQPTNAIYGFIKMLRAAQASVAKSAPRLATEAVGDLLTLVVWDGGLDAGRLAALPGYKAQRPPMPPELRPQIDGIMAYLGAAGIASYCRPGVEADDYIACVARRASQAGLGVVIASSDKDFMQLVTGEEARGEGRGAGDSATGHWPLATGHPPLATGHFGQIGLLNPNDKSETIWGADQVRAKTGVNPVQIVDWLALIGDAVDNIPGVRGVGAKTAAELLKEFGSIAELYRHLDEVKSERLRAALAASAGDVQRNVALVRLKEDLECDFAPEDFAPQPPQLDRLREFFGRCGFRSMLAEVEGEGREARGEGREARGSRVYAEPEQAALL